MSIIIEIQTQTMRVFESKIRDLSKEDYRDVLEELIADLQSRLDCMEEELEDADD